MPRTAMVLVSRSISRMPFGSLIRFCFQSAMGAYGIKRCTLITNFNRPGRPRMKRTVAAFAVLLFATALSADDAGRYLVGTRRAFHAGALQAVRNTIEFEPAQVAPFRVFDGFAATLTADEVAELRASREVR